MTRLLFSRLSLAALLLTLLVWGIAALRPAAHAAPPTDKSSGTAAAAPASLASLLSGKTYPSTLKAEQIDSSFYLVDMGDAQGRPGTYVTKGETAGVGDDTFLVAYFVVVAPGQPVSATVPPGSTLRLALINMHYVQAITNPRAAASAP